MKYPSRGWARLLNMLWILLALIIVLAVGYYIVLTTVMS
jgi:uncharacterized protein YneF (UPF0154 family)